MQHKKICKKCKTQAIGEEKVLDTWATSSLTPQIASSLVKGHIKIPYSLRPQAHDIIRTWAFYTIVKSFYHEQKLPWNEISISGFVTLGGEKMSKSKGNVIAPQDVMKQFGSDALRYWAAGSKLGEDLDYQEKDLVTGKKFVTKILNAANFIFMNFEHQKTPPALCETDRLFLTQLNELISSCTEAFEDYNYSRAKLEADQFFWKTFADNYLEIVKYRVYNGTPSEKASAFYTLYQAFLVILKLMAPITPFITEDIYQTHFKKHEKDTSIHRSSWPTALKVKVEKNDFARWQKLLEVITFVRSEKSKAQKSMKAPITLSLPAADQDLLGFELVGDIKGVTSAKEIKNGEMSVAFV